MNFLFNKPEAFLLLLLLPIWLFWYLKYISKNRLIIPLSYDPDVFYKPKFNLTFLRFLPQFFQWLGIICWIIALARPQSPGPPLPLKTEGIDILFLMDVSASMETEDILPNRIQTAKQSAIKFIQERTDDRIGLLVFAQDAFIVSPLTLDYDLLNTQLKSVRVGMLPKEGTALGQALALGIFTLSPRPSPSKVLILFTDGAANQGQVNPRTAARIAAQKGIKIYSVSIGYPQYTRKLSSGQSTKEVTDLDESLLKELSSLTQGRFFRVTDAAGFQQTLQTISRLERSPWKANQNAPPVELYPVFIIIGCTCLLLGMGMILLNWYNPLEE